MNTPTFETIKACRICGSTQLELIVSLGEMPLANSFLTSEQLSRPEPVYPLEVVFCPYCSLVQLTVSVSPEILFREYLYFSSFSDEVLLHAQETVKRLLHLRNLNAQSLVVEVASNDGYLLQYFVEAGVPVLGIEPALNVARVAEDRGIRTIAEFFNSELAKTLSDQQQSADVIIANNVLAHVPDLNGFVEGIRILLKKKGIAMFEMPYVKKLVDGCEFDTIYHEHLCYYSLTALDQLFRQHDLWISEVERLEIHGGSLRIYVTHPGAGGDRQSVQLILEEENQWGVRRMNYYHDFADKVDRLRIVLCDMLHGLRARGRVLAAYGAAAKGSTLLNSFGLGKDVLDFVVDRNTYKQGRYMPGSHLSIYAPPRLLEVMPDYVLVLAWNFAKEILEQQVGYLHRGGRFILHIPGQVPEVKIIYYKP